MNSVPDPENEIEKEKGGDLDECNVFVKYLPHHYGEEDLQKLFEEFGSIQSVKVMVDPQTGSSLGYGYTLPVVINIVSLTIKCCFLQFR